MSRAILLLNMGGPSNLDEVELFLKNMFDDRYILQTNPILRKIVGKIIVKKRLNEAIENYKALGGKSPLLEITNSLAKKVSSLTNIPTYPVMRYVPPFAIDILKRFKEQNIKELILFSMYPHYSTTTTKSSIEDIKAALKELNYNPTLKIIDRYYNNKEYIEIQASLICEALNSNNSQDINLIISAHGLPMSIIKKGDPYQKEIEENKELLVKELKSRGVEFKDTILAYQSKVGKGAWLEPNLIDILRNPTSLRVLIFPISFTIDNSETIFELDIEHREIANKMGYKFYKVAKCPNDRDDFARFIANMIN
ncbi:MAG: ferrochelatase [Epsilonproteobacteria bacterium]|nr:ferrochelatase [Campylobacterota bacterium]